MAKLAIKGHPTRGEEVIKILEMLGGTNVYHHRGGDRCVGYTVEENEIRNIHYIFGDEDFIFLSIEKFLEKYPYKVGDKVRLPDYESELKIERMKWDGYGIIYEVYTDDYEWFSVEELNAYNEPYKEQETKKVSTEFFDRYCKKCGSQRCTAEGEWLEECKYYKEQEKMQNKQFTDMLDTLSSYLGDFFSPDGVDKAIKYIRENMEEYSKPQYPKTYEECCEVLGCNIDITMKLGIEEDEKLFSLFYMLKTCRNAYWKLADWSFKIGNHDNSTVYAITIFGNGIMKDFYHALNCNRFLVFPTEEMRDAFYENFKQLIEQCKELL